MFRFPWRAGRWPLALALPALWACTDVPSAPGRPSAAEPAATIVDGFAVAGAQNSRTRSPAPGGDVAQSLNFPKITYARLQRGRP